MFLSSLSSSKEILEKVRQSQRSYPSQIITDACCVYRRQIIRPTDTKEMIRRGREIAYEAAHSKDFSVPLPNLRPDESIVRKRKLDPLSTSSQKHSVLITSYLSNDLISRYVSKNSEEQNKFSSPSSTSLLFDVPFYWKQISEKQSIKPKSPDVVSDDEPTKDSHLITNQSKFDSCLTSSLDDETPSKMQSNDDVDTSSSSSEQYSFTDLPEEVQELCQRYFSRPEPIPNLFEQQKQREEHEETPTYVQQTLTPISEESTNIIDLSPTIESHQSSFIFTVQRQSNHIGHYGFEIEETDNHQIRIASILDASFCPNLQIHDEILAVNSNSSLTSLEEYYALFNSLWHRHYQYIHLTIRKSIFSRILH